MKPAVDDEIRIVASRHYYTLPEGEGDEILLSIAQPVQDESGYYRCAYRFTGAVQMHRYAHSVDELGALITALVMAGTDLDFINEEQYGGRLQWDAGAAASSVPTIRDNWPLGRPHSETS